MAHVGGFVAGFVLTFLFRSYTRFHIENEFYIF